MEMNTEHCNHFPPFTLGVLLPSLGWKRGPEGSLPGYLREKEAALKSKLKVYNCAGI